MYSFLGFGDEKKSFDKIVKFIKGPIKFFSKNKESEKELIPVLTFIIRLGIII